MHVVFDDHVPSTKQLVKTLRSIFVVKSICAQNRIGMDCHVIPKDTVGVYGHIGMDNTILADFHMVAYKDIGLYDGPLAYVRTFGNSAACPFERLEILGQFIELPKWLVRNQDRLVFGTLHLFIYEHHSGFGLQGLIIIFGMVHKHNIAFFHHMDLIHSEYGKVFLSYKTGTYDFRYFL